LDYNSEKKCGFCNESIPRGASRCPYCGSILEVTVDESFTDIGTEQQQQDVAGSEPFTSQSEAPKDNPVGGHEPQARQQVQRPYYPGNYQPMQSNSGKAPLSNGLKVFLTVLFTILPGIGQLAGIITAIVFMSAEGDNDRKSFGVALLVASLVMFLLTCIGCFTLAMLGQSLSNY
jgi:hypothetical protein